MVDFNSLLDVSIDDVKAPKALPAGDYNATITAYKFDQTRPSDGKEPTKTLHLDLQLESPIDEIDPEELEGIELSKRRMSYDFYLTPDALFRVKKFLEAIGVARSGASLSELIPEVVQMPCVISVSKALRKDSADEFVNRVTAITGPNAA